MIEVKGLSYIYMKGSPFEKTALIDINLKIGSGEIVGIIGHTGSGKSTLVQQFNGLLKPAAGSVYIDGSDISGKNLKELRKKVGIVFQYPEYQFFEETVYKDMAFGLQKQDLRTEEIEYRIRSAVGSVGLSPEILDKSPFELSGGQKRRVAIAEILVMNPRILVLDEPTAGLDPRGRDEVFSFIQKLHRSSGMTIILVSHYMEDIVRLVDRVFVMNKGRIEMDGPVEDVFEDVERLESIGLSAPQISYLVKKLKKAFPEINSRLYTVKDVKEEILKYIRNNFVDTNSN